MSMTQLEKHIAADLIHEEEATCEIRWEGKQCPNSVQWRIVGHDFAKHEFEPANICNPCLEKARELGYMTMFLGCNECNQSPLIRDIRPV